MKMKHILLVAFGSILLLNCNSAMEETATIKPDAMTTEEHEHETTGAVELNNGERWIVNDEMKPFVEKGESLVNTYVGDGKTDFNNLAEEVKEQNDQLIKSCTMDGKSHEELHKWLHPHLEIVKKLEHETDKARASETVLKLQKSYQQYHVFFK